MNDNLQVEIRRATPAHVPASLSDDALNSDPELNRAVASTAFQLYSDVIKMSLEAASSTGKWLLTIIVAINGGAAVAAGGIEMSSGFKVAAIAAFVAGILSALGASIAVLVTLPTLMKPVGEAANYWLEVRHDGERIAGDHEEQQKELNAAASKAKVWPWGFGIASVGLFVVGIAVAAVGVLSSSS